MMLTDLVAVCLDYKVVFFFIENSASSIFVLSKENLILPFISIGEKIKVENLSIDYLGTIYCDW